MTTSRNGAHTEGKDAHWIEWTTGIVSAALVFALLAWFSYQALTFTPQDPEFLLELKGSTKVDDGWRVEFTVENTANSSASAVGVEGVLSSGDTKQTNQLTFDYVPAQSQATGGLFFTENPEMGKISIRVTGYADP